MNKCLMTPQHEKEIDYGVSVKGKCSEMVTKLKTESIIIQCKELFNK